MRKRKKEILKIIICIMMLMLFLVVIFIFSQQSGELSSMISRKVSNKLGIENSSNSYMATDVQPLIAGLSIRKLAHVTLYAMLGIVSYILIKLLYHSTYRNMKGRIISLLLAEGICILAAIFDELHQYFVPGRSALVSDVLLDSLASLLMIVICFLLDEVWKKLRKIYSKSGNCKSMKCR